MRKAAMVIGLMMLAKGAFSSEIDCNAGFLEQSWELLRLAAYGQSPYERAAFIVRDESGATRFVSWTFQHRSLAAGFTGAVPANAVAIIHTHPNSSPAPSENDVWVAARLRLPVYVITRTMISRTLGSGFAIVTVGDWKPTGSKLLPAGCAGAQE